MSQNEKFHTQCRVKIAVMLTLDTTDIFFDKNVTRMLHIVSLIK